MTGEKQSIRTHYCGELTAKDEGSNATLCGWVHGVRDLGKLHFLTLRDKYGIVQVDFQSFEGDLAVLKDCALESVVCVEGVIARRSPETVNKKMKTGEVELKAKKLTILSQAKKLPFLPLGSVDSHEELKLKYRYLDLRTPKLQDLLQLRSQTTFRIRQFFTDHKFVEVETPILYKATPEGARDFIVPSRLYHGNAYALPQSPQTLKQLLMIAGTDRYFQICRCFRDEDLRADRQPEFSQVDVELSFSSHAEIKSLIWDLFQKVFAEKALAVGESLKLYDMTFDRAISEYGVDRPDLRFGLPHHDFTHHFKDSDFKVFKDVANKSGLVKAIFLPKVYGELSRKQIATLETKIKQIGAKGLAFLKQNEKGELEGGISKFLDASLGAVFQKAKEDISYPADLNCEDELSTQGQWLFMASEDRDLVDLWAHTVRASLAKDLNLYKRSLAFVWVHEFPVFEYSKEEKRLKARHHPFTRPMDEDRELFFSESVEDLKKCRADAYDIVLNGHEIGGGSQRIFDASMQRQMFKLLGLSDFDVREKFGFFVEALTHGVPPHGGIALGLDRLTMLLGGTENIRDVIAFPKTTKAQDLMSGTPSLLGEDELKDLGIHLKKSP